MIHKVDRLCEMSVDRGADADADAVIELYPQGGRGARVTC